jgi:hypothetical protein
MSGRAAPGVRRVLAGAMIAVLFCAVHAVAQTPPATLTPSTPSVAPVPADADIRDIRGPKHIPSVWTLPLLLAGGVLLASGAYAAWRLSRRRRPQRVKLPFELALSRLEHARALMHPENGREFSIEVSDAVREYIERRFCVMAAHRTTHEFLRDLLGAPDALLAAHRALLADFLNLCDLAKFAGWHLSMQDMQTLHQSAREFVLETGRAGAAPRSAVGKDIYDSLPAT